MTSKWNLKSRSRFERDIEKIGHVVQKFVSRFLSGQPQILALERTVLRELAFATLFLPILGPKNFFSKETLKLMSGLSQTQDKPSKSLD